MLTTGRVPGTCTTAVSTTIMYCTVRMCRTSTQLHYCSVTVMYCAVLYCTLLLLLYHCAALYRTVQYCSSPRFIVYTSTYKLWLPQVLPAYPFQLASPPGFHIIHIPKENLVYQTYVSRIIMTHWDHMKRYDTPVPLSLVQLKLRDHDIPCTQHYRLSSARRGNENRNT